MKEKRKEYADIFFDLDHTLWDFETNSKLTLHEVFEQFNLKSKGCPSFKEFESTYRKNNNELWSLYRINKIKKETLRTERFRRTLYAFTIKDKKLSEDIGEYYITESPQKTALFPGTIEMLTTIGKLFNLHIITNGFEEVQHTKLKSSGLIDFFDKIITSEQAGVKKPHISIFEYAMRKSGAWADSSLMVGDNQEVDIAGAKASGIDQIFFNPNGEETTVKATYEIAHLNEIVTILS